MKKILKLVIMFVIVVIGLQISVQADMGIPEIRTYKAKVINPNGTIGYDYNGNAVEELKYGDEIEIQYETFWADIEEAVFYKEIDGHNLMVHVKLKDIASVEDMYISENLDIEVPRDRVVVDEHGAILYKGPGFAYEKTGKIVPKGTEITAYAEKNAGENPWFYTTYEGVSGWVCELECLGTYYSEVVIAGDVESWERTTGDVIPEEKGIIPGKKIIKNIVLLDPWEQRYYFKYNGEWVTIRFYNELHERPDIIIFKALEDIKIYEDIFDESAENVVIGTIPANTEFAVKYYSLSDNFLVRYNGVEGWVYNISYENSVDKGDNVETTNLELPTLEDFTVIESPDIPFEKVKKREEKREEKTVENVVIVEDINVENSIAVKEENNDEKIDVEVNENNKESEELVVEVETNQGETSNKEDVRKAEVTPEQIVAFGVVGAIVIALTCIVTIVLINKTSKKNNKKEEVKVESKEEK